MFSLFLNHNITLKLPQYLSATGYHRGVASFGKKCTWSTVSFPAGKTPMDVNGFIKAKLMADGTVHHYKAQLVVNGYTQQERVD